jgi:hypothetical protein
MDDAVKPLEGSSRARKTAPKNPDRIVVTPEALQRLNGWLQTLEHSLKGVRLSRNQLVSWLISSHPESLSEEETSSIESRYFDEVKFAEWALRELKRSKAIGQSTTLAEIIVRKREAGSDTKRKNRRKHSISPIENDAEKAGKSLEPNEEK